MVWMIVAGVLALLVLLLVSSLKVVTEYERAVFFRLGHLKGAKGPGLILVIPVIDRIVRVSLRTVALEIPVQELVTKDNVTAAHRAPPGGPRLAAARARNHRQSVAHAHRLGNRAVGRRGHDGGDQGRRAPRADEAGHGP